MSGTSSKSMPCERPNSISAFVGDQPARSDAASATFGAARRHSFTRSLTGADRVDIRPVFLRNLNHCPSDAVSTAGSGGSTSPFEGHRRNSRSETDPLGQ